MSSTLGLATFCNIDINSFSSRSALWNINNESHVVTGRACHLVAMAWTTIWVPSPGGGTPYVMGDTYVPRFWPPFLTLAGSSTIFLGCFFSSTNTKTIFWVQILAKFDLFGPKIPFFPRSFWVQFSVARGTPPAIFGPSTPPGVPSHCWKSV